MFFTAVTSTPRSEDVRKLEAKLQTLQATVTSLESNLEQDREKALMLERRLEEVEQRAKAAWEAGKDSLPRELDTEGNKQEASPTNAELVDCSLRGRVWDAVVLIGLPEVGLCSSLALLGSGLLSVLVQLCICYMLVLSDSFIRPRAFKALVPAMQHWRFSVAHEPGQMDARGASLASRVCRGDASVAVAGAQLDLLSEINAYLGLGPADLELQGLTPGPVLCSTCLLLFGLRAFHELRHVVVSLFAVSSLPRRPTRIEGRSLAALSNARFVVLLVAAALRVCLGVALVVAGFVWLSLTSSIAELLIRLAALSFVLELDELLFEATVSSKVQTLMRDLAPVKYRRLGCGLETASPLVASLAAIGLSAYLLMRFTVADMLEVKQALCGGNQDFVTSASSAGFYVSWPTEPFDELAATPALQDMGLWAEDLGLLAVQELVTGPEAYPAQNSVWLPFASSKDLDDLSQQSPCADLDTFDGGSLKAQFPGWFTAARELAGLWRGRPLSEHPFVCSEYAGFCDKTGLLRSICPVTCGCDDPRSGLLPSRPKQGCPTSCTAVVTQALAATPCVDLNASSSKPWTRYWQEYAQLMAQVVPQQATLLASFVKEKLARGCDDNAPDPFTGHSFCDDQAPMLEDKGLGSILAFCPATCCRGPSPLARCPRACTALTGLGLEGEGQAPDDGLHAAFSNSSEEEV